MDITENTGGTTNTKKKAQLNQRSEAGSPTD